MRLAVLTAIVEKSAVLQVGSVIASSLSAINGNGMSSEEVASNTGAWILCTIVFIICIVILIKYKYGHWHNFYQEGTAFTKLWSQRAMDMGQEIYRNSFSQSSANDSNGSLSSAYLGANINLRNGNGSNQNSNNNSINSNHWSYDDDRENGSGIMLLKLVLKQLQIPEFAHQEYINKLRDDFLTTEEQLQQLNSDDWRRLGFPFKIENAIKRKLNDDINDGKQTNPNPNPYSMSSQRSRNKSRVAKRSSIASSGSSPDTFGNVSDADSTCGTFSDF
jgi:hypothetical protein